MTWATRGLSILKTTRVKTMVRTKECLQVCTTRQLRAPHILRAPGSMRIHEHGEGEGEGEIRAKTASEEID